VALTDVPTSYINLRDTTPFKALKLLLVVYFVKLL